MRSIVELDIAGVRIVGTRHERDHSSGGGKSERTGVVIFNAGFLPRAGRGDLFAHLADWCAETGAPAFRFDMPGLGDSGGVLPELIPTMFRLIQSGGHSDFGAVLIEEIARRFNVQRLVLGGNCGGAITSIYVAAKAGRRTRGVFLLDPDFTRLSAAPNTPVVVGVPEASRVHRIRESLVRNWGNIKRRPALSGVRAAYNKRRVWLDRLRGWPLPADANAPLLEGVDRLVGAGTPMLLLTPKAAWSEMRYAFDFVAYLRRRHGGRIEFADIANTDHTFVGGNGAEAVRERLALWLGRHGVVG